MPAPFPTPAPRPSSPEPPPGLEPVLSPPALSAVDRPAVVGTALSLRGAPYRNGGTDPSGFDCSGFVAYVFAQQGLYMPRTVSEQYAQGHAGRAGLGRSRRPRVLQHGGSWRIPRRHRHLSGRVRPRPQLQRCRPGRVTERALLVLPLGRDAADPLVRSSPPAAVFARIFVRPSRPPSTRRITVSRCKH